jgi:hypothetical protein
MHFMKLTMKLSLLTLPIATIWSLALNGCGDKTSNEECYNFHEITGVVRDSVSGLPLDSALVSLHDTTGVTSATDSLGGYTVGAAGCSMVVLVRKTGYAMKIRNLTGLQGNVAGVDFDLVRE